MSEAEGHQPETSAETICACWAGRKNPVGVKISLMQVRNSLGRESSVGSAPLEDGGAYDEAEMPVVDSSRNRSDRERRRSCPQGRRALTGNRGEDKRRSSICMGIDMRRAMPVASLATRDVGTTSSRVFSWLAAVLRYPCESGVWPIRRTWLLALRGESSTRRDRAAHDHSRNLDLSRRRLSCPCLHATCRTSVPIWAWRFRFHKGTVRVQQLN